MSSRGLRKRAVSRVPDHHLFYIGRYCGLQELALAHSRIYCSGLRRDEQLRMYVLAAVRVALIDFRTAALFLWHISASSLKFTEGPGITILMQLCAYVLHKFHPLPLLIVCSIFCSISESLPVHGAFASCQIIMLIASVFAIKLFLKSMVLVYHDEGSKLVMYTPAVPRVRQARSAGRADYVQQAYQTV
jgi:hypothetical protein